MSVLKIMKTSEIFKKRCRLQGCTNRSKKVGCVCYGFFHWENARGGGVSKLSLFLLQLHHALTNKTVAFQ